MSTTSTLATTRRFAGDPVHSTFGFAVRHMGVSLFRGNFSEVTAALTIDPDGVGTLVGAAEVESISISSPADFRAHVLGDDFFAADQHPSLSFRASRIVLPADGGNIQVPGVLTIRGISRNVDATGIWNAPVDDPFGGVRAALELRVTVDRRDFGMSWNVALPKGGQALGTDVNIDVHLEVVEEA